MHKISKNIYQIPLNKTEIISTSSDPETHTGMDENAIDFAVREDSKVFAAAAGEIIFVKDDSAEGGDDEKYEDFTFYNHIVIKHDNGEYTEYGHLKNKSALKKVGDKVVGGEAIALSGNTGYSSEPHLHFSFFVLDKMDEDFSKLPKNKEYFINDEDFGFQTIKANFLSRTMYRLFGR